MKRIIFCAQISDMEGFTGIPRLIGSLSANDRDLLIQKFSDKYSSVDEILVSRAFVTGWRANLFSDEVEISFIGDDWTEKDKCQGRGRCRPTIFRKQGPNMMTPFYIRRPTKTLRRRFWSFCDDCAWSWNRHKHGFIGGFALGCLVVLIALEFALGV